MSKRFVLVVLLVLPLALGGCAGAPDAVADVLDFLFVELGLEVDPSGAGSGGPNPSGMAGGGAGPGG